MYRIFKLVNILIFSVVVVFYSCRQDHKTTVAPSSTCETANITFAVVKPIFDRNCTGCHSELETEQDAKSWGAIGMIVAAVKHESSAMPMPKGSPKLTDCEISKIEAWYNTIN